MFPVEGLESRTLPSAVIVTSTPGPKGSVNLKFAGSAADDLVRMNVDENLNVRVFGGTFSLNGGSQQTDLRFGKINNLTFNLGAGSDTGWIENVSAHNVTINDGWTRSETNQYTVISTTHNMRLNNVEANFNFGHAEFTMDSRQSVLTECLTIGYRDTSTSRTVLSVTQGSTLGISGQFSIVSPASSASTDYVLLQAFRNSDSDAVQLRLRGGTRWNLGGGNDLIQIAGAAEFSGQTVINTGDGDDRIGFAVGGNLPVSGDLVFRGRVSIETGAGADFLSCASAEIHSDRVRFLQAVSIETGQQNDQVNLYKTVFSSSLTVDTGNSNPSGSEDLVLISDVQVFGSTEIRSAGRATAHVGSNSSATTRFAGNARFTLGSGSVVVGNGNPAFPQVIFDGFQVFTGIRSTITVKYVGTIQSDPGERRLIRAVLV